MPVMLTESAPFVILDRGDKALLYRAPRGEIVAHAPGEIAPALAALESALADGNHCAGYLSYEAGLMLEPRLTPRASSVPPGSPPLLWFGIFASHEELPSSALRSSSLEPCQVGEAQPCISRQEYGARFTRVQQLIDAGDIYQINLTFPARVPLRGNPMDIYSLLRDRAGARHGGVVRLGHDWFLSFSPELFFEIVGGQVTCRPMKGTAARQAHPDDDARAAAELAGDPKQLAENLMITDLLRNDLSRVARPSSVRVPQLFQVESYPTVHQLTSTVEAQLLPGITATDLIRALFPCGSITGTPKIRAMELIDEIEAAPRGIYTGSIGAFSPDGTAYFNVAIRTLALTEGSDCGVIGLGSAIVADSEEQAEWDECLQKSMFLTAAGPAHSAEPKEAKLLHA